MKTIDHFNLRNFDLNLLIAFDAMMEELNVTRAAARLKIQQPAMSHALKTLRMLFDDELFVRVGQVMKPTSRAISLASRVRSVLQKAEDALSFSEQFSPLTEQRTFRLGFSSELEVHLLPELMTHLRKVAPGVRVIASYAGRQNLHGLLERGEIDLALGCFGEQGQWHRSEVLFAEQLACCFNPALMPFSTPLSQDDYLNQPHALMSFSGNLMGCVENAFNRAGATLNAVFSAQNFLALLSFAQNSPVLVTLPNRIARRYCAMFGLVYCEVPLQLEVFPNSIVWPVNAENDPALEWLRDQIRAVNQRIESADVMLH